MEVKQSAKIYKPLVSTKTGYYVLISHHELDDLIGRLMQMLELNGDVEQRNALKQETKWRCRSWLDTRYEQGGYVNYAISDDANVVSIEIEE